MRSRDETAIREFLLALTELTRKYGISVGGCGCCGSPWLDVDADVRDSRSGYCHTDGNEVRWIAPSNEDDWEEHSYKIVRKEEEQ